jgi:hypothetical protein
MGIFASRPEEPFEWAGLPSEPLRPESDAERLDAPSADLLGLSGGDVGSIVVPVAPVQPAAADEDPAED